MQKLEGWLIKSDTGGGLACVHLSRRGERANERAWGEQKLERSGERVSFVPFAAFGSERLLRRLEVGMTLCF